ncbi:L-alanine-DL-glutamate epimerase [Flavobacteriaceae bacterium MAR_2010_188]|nr:L-alanine-DL-glutamate epimerase [Flavobacteriaceae bacterium MAR_2010_188]
MKLSVKSYPFSLALRYPFTISRYTVENQDTFIVEISDGEFSGYGEATANPFYESTLDNLKKSVESVAVFIENSTDLHPDQLWEILHPHLLDNYFALCAIDCAFWDYYGKRNKIKLHQFFSNGRQPHILSSYTIGIDTLEKMKSKISDLPWPIYKIKLGTYDDLQIMKEIRNSTDSVLRIDANCAWTAKQTIEYSLVLRNFKVEYIEQPLKPDDLTGMKLVYSESVLPIIADESCQKYADVDKCAGHFHGINIKLTKCGGLTPALKMIRRGRELGLKIMVGCMTESTVGISNLLQLAPLLDYLDADGALLLKEDVAQGAKLKDGKVIFSDKFGSGIDFLFNKRASQNSFKDL